MECPLLSALASEGNTLEVVVQLFFFSVLLVVLRRKSGGVRPDWCWLHTLRHLEEILKWHVSRLLVIWRMCWPLLH